MKIEQVAGENTAFPKSSGQAAGSRSEPGEFDLAVAAVYALLSPASAAPVNSLQGQGGSGAETASGPGPGNLNMVDAAVLFEAPATGLPDKGPQGGMIRPQPAGGGDWSKNAGVPQVLPEAAGPEQAAVTQDELVPVQQQQNSRETPGVNLGPEQAAAPVQEAAKTNVPAAGLPADTRNLRAEEAGIGEKADEPAAGLTADTAEKSKPAKSEQVNSEQVKSEQQNGLLKNGLPENIRLAEKPEYKNGPEGVKPVEKNETVRAGSAEAAASAWEKTKTAGAKQGNFSSTQPAPVQTGTSSPVQTPGDLPKGVELPDLKERLVQEIRYMYANRKGEPQTRVQLKLEPEHLGQLTIRLFFSRGELSAHFYTGSSYVKDILEGSIQHLREALGQQDLRLNEALVFAGGDGRGGMGHYPGEKSGQAAPFVGYGYRPPVGAPLETAEITATETIPSRVNYLV